MSRRDYCTDDCDHAGHAQHPAAPASPPASPGGGEALPWAEPYGSDPAFLAATEAARRLAMELQWTYDEAEVAERCAHELWRLGWRLPAPTPPGGDGAREARERVAEFLAAYTHKGPGRYAEQLEACEVPDSNGDRWLALTAADLRALLSEGGEGR